MPGHLNVKYICLLICMFSSYIVTFGYQTFIINLYDMRAFINNCIIIAQIFVLSSVYTYLFVRCELFDFTVKSIIGVDQMVEVVAIGSNGNDVFRFEIN